MPTDYRKLCVNLFGTDDVAKLERIATELKTKNPAMPAGRRSSPLPMWVPWKSSWPRVARSSR